MRLLRTIFSLIRPKRRREAGFLLAFMLLGALLETLGIGLVIPALAVMANPDPASLHPVLAEAVGLVPNPTRERLVVYGLAILVVAYALKTAMIIFVAWRQARFVSHVQSDLASRIFASYLRQPYTFHLGRNSAELVHNASTFPQGVAGAAQQLLLLATELCVLIGISALLLIVEPVGTVVTVGVIGTAGWLFSALSRSRTLRWGESYDVNSARRLHHLQEGFGGVKEIKLLGREGDLLSKFDTATVLTSRAQAHRNFLQGLPRLWLEFLAVFALAAIVFLSVQRGRPVEFLLPTLGLFAAAAFRIMPSVNRIVGALDALRFNQPVVERARAEIRQIGDPPPVAHATPMPIETSIKLDRITFRYPKSTTDALANVSLEILRGTSVGFVGGSGAGKSTLVEIILGLLTPLSGAVLVDGRDIQSNLRGWQQTIGYVPQHVFLSDDTLRGNVAFGLASTDVDDEAVRRAIKSAQMEDFVRGLPEGLDTKVGERGVRLSGGQRQRIGIARALYHDPEVLVLDEATSALDGTTERGVMDAVRALHGQKTVLVVAHRLSTVADCDRIFQFEEGRLVEQGDASGILSKLG